MYKVGEFSKLSRITAKTLRYYDYIGLFKPKHINEETGYRYYTIDQLKSLYRIVELREFGFTISEILELTQEEENTDSDEKITVLLRQKQQEIEEQINDYKRKLNQIKAYMDTIETEEKEESHSVVVKEVPKLIVASLRRKLYDYSDLNDYISEMELFLKKQNIRLGNPDYCFTIYHDGEYKENNIDAEMCQIVSQYGQNSEKIKFKELEKIDTAACILHYGTHKQIRKSYGYLVEWIARNNYVITGALRECYLEKVIANQESIYSNGSAVIEIQAPIKRDSELSLKLGGIKLNACNINSGFNESV